MKKLKKEEKKLGKKNKEEIEKVSWKVISK